MSYQAGRNGPGFFGIVFGVATSISLGVALAAAHLVAKPVEVVPALPKEPAPGAVYFIQGNVGAGPWQKKSAKLQTPGAEISFTEGEINAWSVSAFAKVDEKPKEPPFPVFVVPGKPNFRLIKDQLQLGSVSHLHVSDTAYPLVFQARGTFIRSEGGWQYTPSECYLGSLPLHKIPSVVPALFARLKSIGDAPTELSAVLQRAKELSVADGMLVVRMP